MLRKVILSGELAKRFGRSHQFDIATPAEAVRALCANFSEFANFMLDSEKRNVAYRVIVDKQRVDSAERLHEPFSQVVRIVPVIGGAKSALGGILLGAVIIGAAFLTGGASLAATGLVFSGLAGQLAFGIGASLVLSGVSALLSPQAKAGAPSEAANNQPSYYFNGAVNTTQQGQPVPVGYGRLIVGSAVISAGATSDEYGAAGMA